MGRGACQQNFGILRPFPPCPKTHASSLRGHHLLRSHNFRDFGPPPPLFAVSRNISVLLFAKLATSLSANVINGSVINRSMIRPMLWHYYSAEAESCFGLITEMDRALLCPLLRVPPPPLCADADILNAWTTSRRIAQV